MIRNTITLEQYLKKLPASLVYGRFKHASPARKIISSSGIGAIVGELSEKRGAVARFNALSDENRSVCALAYLLMPAGVRHRQPSGFDDELLAAFLAYAVKDPDGTCHYRGFAELEKGLRQVCIAHLLAKLGREPAQRNGGQWPHRGLNDLAVVLALAANGLLKPTKNGSLAKTSLDIARKLLFCGRNIWKQDFHRTVLLLIDFCVSRELVCSDGTGFACRIENTRAFLGKGARFVQHELAAFCTTHEPLWNWDMAREVLSVEPPVRLSLSGLNTDQKLQLRDAVRVGDLLGMVDVSRSDEEFVFGTPGRPSETSAQRPASPGAARLTIMPDFSAVIPMELEPLGLFEFSLLGEITSLDRVYSGKITRNAVLESLCRGIGHMELTGVMEQWQAPSNVVATVREWVREFSRLSLCTESTVLTTDARVTELVGSCEPLRRILTPVAVHGVFRVRPGREREAGELLTGLGFDHRMPCGPASPPEPSAVTGTPPREETEVVVSFEDAPAPPARVSRGKYSSQMNALDTSELYHVIDYAVLMGQAVKLEYDGGLTVRRGTYSVVPVEVVKKPEPALDAEDCGSGKKRRFLLSAIKKIGVLHE